MARTRKRPYSSLNSSCRYGTMTTIRSGKWTAEEEALASKLIYEFEIGILSDCDEGATLRSYLARKLNCAPMRISKKFAGQCIGKHIYTSRNSTTSSSSWICESPPQKPAKKARPTLPSRSSSRYRQTPDSFSDASMVYNYDSSSSTTSDTEDEVKRSGRNRNYQESSYEDSLSSPVAVNQLDLGRKLRVTESTSKHGGSKPPYLFAPIKAHPISTRATAVDYARRPMVEAVVHLDFEHELHGSAAEEEGEEWREVLMEMFGRADSESPTHEDEVFHGEEDQRQHDDMDGSAEVYHSSAHATNSPRASAIVGRKQPLSTLHRTPPASFKHPSAKRSTLAARSLVPRQHPGVSPSQG